MQSEMLIICIYLEQDKKQNEENEATTPTLSKEKRNEQKTKIEHISISALHRFEDFIDAKTNYYC